MQHSDDFFDDGDDTEFLAVATQLEASQYGGNFTASPRPVKRRRVTQLPPTQLDGVDCDGLSDFENDQESLPETGDREPAVDAAQYFPCELGEDTTGNAKNSKYKIHIPKDGGQFSNAYFTQTQHNLDLDPAQFRGPVWKKPRQVVSPPAMSSMASVRGTGTSAGLQLRRPNTNVLQPKSQSQLNFGRKIVAHKDVESDGQLAARLQAKENELFHHRGKLDPPTQLAGDASSFNAIDELGDLPSDAFASSPEASLQREVITLSSQQAPPQALNRGLRGPQTGLKQMTMFGQPATQTLSASQAVTKKHAWPLKASVEPPTHHKLDLDAMRTWTYPTNLGTIRDYQYNIVKRSLFHNTLVALPTGLGKTFIAATVMLNFYRWTADSQIVFMAPTKPLIAQQMEACYQIAGIPRRDTVLMTGETTPVVRGDEWQERRVFFMTPQTVMNDLKTGIADPKKLVLLVVDEAHKATGGYAYTEVITFVRRFNTSFRVLALTATPGSTVESVQAVIDNLDISRVELRTELSIDIRAYTHEKQTDNELFDFSDEQQLIMEHLTKALKPSLDKLNAQNAYWSRDPMMLTAFGMQQSRAKWMQSDAGRKAPMGLKGMVNAMFTVLSSFGHGIGLLKFHGIVPFYSSILGLQRQVENGEAKGKTLKGIVESEHFMTIANLIRGWTNNPDFIGHPKLEYLRGVVLNHFLDAGEGRQGLNVPPSSTRVMVFASYRDSAEDICRVLKRNEPMIRPHVFVGQSGKVGSDGMNQKKQNEVVQDFKAGKYNTLVATSIGEEGLDIGDVDLIVCYDASASPIRMLQRIGRTGRKRMGRIVLLLMKDKEEKDYQKAQDNYAYIQKTIADTNKYNYHDDRSSRILPKDIVPVEDKRVIDIPPENSQPIDLVEKGRKAKAKGRKRPPKKSNMPDGVRTGFVKASRFDEADDDDQEDGNDHISHKKKVPAKKTTSRSKAAVVPKPEVAPLPFLQDVILNNVQMKELERKYAHVAGNEADAIIGAPDLNRFPETWRALGTTRSISHGRVTMAVAKTMRAIHLMDDAHVQRLGALLDKTLLHNAGPAAARLVSPQANNDDVDHPLPSIAPAPQRAPVQRKPIARKRQAIPRTASLPSAATTTPARRKKSSLLQRSFSHNPIEAMDGGVSSSPEPTPADMRIGTQGIDLGSRDTSGEDEDEEPDSELDAFVARSDEPILEASSSSPLLMGSQDGTPVGGHDKGRGRGQSGVYLKDGKGSGTKDRRGHAIFSDDLDLEGGDGAGLEDAIVVVASSPPAPPSLEVPTTTVTRRAGRKRKVVVDDSDSDDDS